MSSSSSPSVVAPSAERAVRAIERAAKLAAKGDDAHVVVASKEDLAVLPVAAVRVILGRLPKAWQPNGSHMGLPAAPINWLFYHLFRTERYVAPRYRSPAGVSALLVLRRRHGSR